MAAKKTQTDWSRIRRERMAAKGLCVTCSKPLDTTAGRCLECKARRRAYETDLRQARIAEGICSSCGKVPAIKGKLSCQRCADRGIAKGRTLRLAAMDAYGGPTCACCGEKTIEFLQIDHIDGGGNKQLRNLKVSTLYQWLKSHKYPPGFQVLCANCNFAKGAYGVCPHQKKPIDP
jgi:hypothetical protein